MWKVCPPKTYVLLPLADGDVLFILSTDSTFHLTPTSHIFIRCISISSSFYLFVIFPPSWIPVLSLSLSLSPSIALSIYLPFSLPPSLNIFSCSMGKYPMSAIYLLISIAVSQHCTKSSLYFPSISAVVWFPFVWCSLSFICFNLFHSGTFSSRIVILPSVFICCHS